MIVDALVAELGFLFTGDREVAKFDQAFKRAANGLTQFSDRVANVTRAAVLGIGAITGGLGAALGKNVIGLSAEWEKYTATLTTIEGSEAKAAASLDWVADFAKKTPYDLAQVTQAFIKMKAYGLDPTDGSLQALGDAGSAMGKDLMSAVEAMADAVNGENERLKEFGLTSKTEGEMITYSWNKNGQAFSKTIRKNGEEVSRFIREHMNTQFGGAMLRQSSTWEGMMSNLGDSWDDFQRRIGAGGFFQTVKNRLSDVLDYVGELDRNGKLDEWSANLSWAFTKAADGVTVLARRMKANIETIGKLWSDGGWSEKIEPFKYALGLLLAAMFPVTALFVAAAFALDDWLAYMAGADSVIGNFIDTIANFLGADPATVASVLGDMAQAAGWLVAGAVGIGLFAGALRQLSGALLILKGAGWAVKLLGSLAGIRWGAAAAGAAGAATAAGAAGAGAAGAGASAAGFSPVGPIVAGAAAAGALTYGSVKNLGDEQRKALYDDSGGGVSILGAMAPDLAFGAAIMDASKNRRSNDRTKDDYVAPPPPSLVNDDGREALAGIIGRIDAASSGLVSAGQRAMRGMKAEFGIDESDAVAGAKVVADIVSTITSMTATAKAILDVSQFMAPANQALAIQSDLSKGISATARLDVSQWMAAADKAEARIRSLNSLASGLGGTGAAVAPRPAVVQSASTP